MNSHLSDRFYQRYGHELTLPILRELIALAEASKEVSPDPVQGRERVSFVWREQRIRMVWHRGRRCAVTFLPPVDRAARIAWCLPKRKRRR